MSAVLDDPNEYMKNPLYQDREFGDFSAFYITVAICFVFILIIVVLNLFFCVCSQHRHYWLDSNTGNRWISALWTKTPYKQPPLDLTELRVDPVPEVSTWEDVSVPDEYLELKQKHPISKESDL